MGLKSADCASIRGHSATAEFLLMFETSLGITRWEILSGWNIIVLPFLLIATRPQSMLWCVTSTPLTCVKCHQFLWHLALTTSYRLSADQLLLCRDLLARERSQDALVSENGELKTNFKWDILTFKKTKTNLNKNLTIQQRNKALIKF